MTRIKKHLTDDKVLDQGNLVLEELLEPSSSASKEMAIDGTTPVIFKAVPSADKYWLINRLLIYYSAATPFSENKFGIITLTNGISVLANNVEIINWMDNMDVQTTMFDADSKAAYTKEDRSISGRLSFFKLSVRTEGLLINDNTNGFGIKIQDNLSTLTFFRARIGGMKFDKLRT